MPNPRRRSKKDQPTTQRLEPASSHGIQSAAETPKDVSPECAAARDLTEHRIHSDDLEVRTQAWLDEAIEETFPASDPIAVPTFEEARKIRTAQKARVGAAAKVARR